MCVLPETIAFDDGFDFSDTNKQVFSISRKHCLPGYTRLRELKLDPESSVDKGFKTMMCDKNRREYPLSIQRRISENNQGQPKQTVAISIQK